MSNNLSDEDFITLERIRAMCHGGAAALGLAIDGEGSINLINMREMLQESNRGISEFLSRNGGHVRAVELRDNGKYIIER